MTESTSTARSIVSMATETPEAESPEAQPSARGSLGTWAGAVRVEASPSGVRAVYLPRWQDGQEPLTTGIGALTVEPGADAASEVHLRRALAELAAYFGGWGGAFTVALDLDQGPPFYRAAWAEVARVPYGETRSYGEIAAALGQPTATRAVGAANGANPLAPFIPCHRIVGSDGSLTGYGPGLPLKQRLLAMEGAIPASPGDYPDWIERLSARLGLMPLLGVRAARVYCSPTCARPQRESRPMRFFASATEAEAAGYSPCPRCQGGKMHSIVS